MWIIIYGIKEKTYTIDGNVAKFASGVDPLKSNYMNWSGQWGLWRMPFLRPDELRDENYWTKYNEFIKLPSNIMSPLAGFVPDTESIKTEIAKRDALHDELGKLLQFGIVKDVDKALNEYIEKQKAVGLDKILAELQKQVDAFRAGNK